METTTRVTCGTCKGAQVMTYDSWGGRCTDACDTCLGIGTVLTHEATTRVRDALAAGMSWDEAYDLVR
jgi:hypothetical protein